MPEVFISYSHRDSLYAHRLADELRRQGIDVWIDERIDYGDQWPRVIQDNLNASRAFLLVMSTNAFESMWVQNEVSYAQANSKLIYPLLLEGPVWLSMAAMQYVDVRNGDMPPERFLRELRADLDRAAAPMQVQPAAPARPLPGAPVRKPAARRGRRLLYIGLPLLLCLAVVGVLTPRLWRQFSPLLFPEPAAPVRATAARPSATPRPAAPSVIREPPSPTPAPAEMFGPESYGLEIAGLWIGLGAVFDMDTVSEIQNDSSDLFLENDGLLVPINGARLSDYGHPDPVDLTMCLEIINSMETPAAQLQTDLYYCFLTNTGRYGYLVPRQIDLERGIVADVRVFP